MRATRMDGKKPRVLQRTILTTEYKDMFMLEMLISFFMGSIFTAIVLVCYYRAFDLQYLLNTIKEDVTNLHVNVAHLLDKTK